MATTLFKTKAVKIDTLGEYLQQVRNQLNLDLRTVSLLTQIKPSYIEQLEKADYSSLPADVYIRGFLKSLATLYRIKEQILIDQYEKERGFPADGLTLGGEGTKNTKITSKLSLTPKTIILGLSLLVA